MGGKNYIPNEERSIHNGHKRKLAPTWGNFNALIPEQNLIVKNKYTYGYRGFSLSYSHNFGNDKVKGKRDRTTSAEDEKGRGY